MRLMVMVASVVERQEIVRKRSFSVRNLDDVAEVLRALQRECFIGSVTCHVGPGGQTSVVEAEERRRL